MNSTQMTHWRKAATRAVALALIGATSAAFAADSGIQRLGSAGLRTAITNGDRQTPLAQFRTPEMMRQAAPTNQWYSSVMFTQWSNVLHASPLTFKATPEGLEVGLPEMKVVPTERKDTEIHYPHRADLTIQPTDFKPKAALLAGRGDWSIDMAFAQGADAMKATILHGSPVSYLSFTKGNAAVRVGGEGDAKVWAQGANTLVVKWGNRQFAVFAPVGSTWKQGAGQWMVEFPAAQRYLSVASLPNVSDATVSQFEQSAHLEVVDTRADFRIDAQASEVITTFSASTKARSSTAGKPMLGLYPHHYFGNQSLTQASAPGFQSVRGAIRLLQADSFQTRHPYTGFVPYWPQLSDQSAKKELSSLIKKDAKRARRMMLEIGYGPYWQGKGLQRIALLMGVAAREGMDDVRDDLLDKLKERAESWFSGQSDRTYFHYDKQLGTVVSYPEEYDAVKDMNDHHFHYGYWIRAAAEIGLYDRDWIAPGAWGGIVDELIKDIATAERGRADYPYIRNFDPYEGHSWASGVATSDDGNNQESSSEAINAWSGLMLWGMLHNRPELIELGTYLYATEIQAVNHYWFDIHQQTLPKAFESDQVSMVFGGKLLHNTWWIDEPRQIHGINLLPFTPASTYLGTSRAFVNKAMDALEKETEIYNARGKRAKPEDIWQDLFAQHLALVDPEAGFKRWDRWGSYELGDTRSHTYHWLESLRAMGPVDLSVRANTRFYSVFKKGAVKTYLVYNPATAPVEVVFSDGHRVQAAPGLTQHVQ